MSGATTKGATATGATAEEGFRPRDPAFERKIRESFARQGFMATLGAELTHVAPGAVDISLSAGPAVGQQHGFVHGGAVGAIADSAGGYAGLSLMAPGHAVLTVEYKMNLIAPAAGPRIVARGRVQRPGKTLTVTEVRVVSVAEDGTETPCALMLQTLIGLPEAAGRPAG